MAKPNPELPSFHTPDLQEVTLAYSDIVRHNSVHTGYSAVTKGTLLGGGDKIEEVALEGDMNADLQKIFHKETLLRVGINFKPIGHIIANSDGEAVTSPQLALIIEKTSLFTEFLSKIQPEDIQNDDNENFLSAIIANLSSLTDICFNTEKQKDLSDKQIDHLEKVGVGVLRKFIAIDPEYERLGIDGAVMRKRVKGISKELSEFFKSGQGGAVPPEISDEQIEYAVNEAKMYFYEGMINRVHYWGRNLLPEYIEAEHGEYLTPPEEQGFGPAHWQREGGQFHWQEAFDFLERLELDARTRDFADEVRICLLTSVEYAIAKASEPGKEVYLKNQVGDLENLRNALADQEFDFGKLADYIKKPDYLS